MAAVEENGRPRRTRMPAARRRETILTAAAEVFAEAGYRAARISDIAARIGVTEPVVFQNFGSKPALFAAVLEHAAGDARDFLDQAATRPVAAGGLLAHVLCHPPAGHLPGGPEPAGHGAPGLAFGVLFADAIGVAADPALADVSGQVLRALAGHLADLVRRGQEDGSVRAGLAPEAAAWLLISVLAARPLREAAMPAGLEPQVAELAVGLLTAPPQ
jgi:AcrR family transcriptional regulator